MEQTPSLRRPDIYVLCRIIERLWKENGPMLRTHLQLASNMSYDSLVRYLDWMEDRNLVALERAEDGHEVVVLTEKGRKAYGTIALWVNEYVMGQAK